MDFMVVSPVVSFFSYLCNLKICNMKLQRFIYTAVLAAIAAGVWAGPIDDARKLYAQGEYETVVEKMRPQVKKTPKDGNANYFLGASLYALGDFAQAKGPLTVAEGRGVAEASRMLTEMALDRYDVEAAEEHLDKWEAALKKGKKSTPALYDELTSRMIQMRNMLDRVERIEIVDSITVDSADFFRAYRLSAEAGRLLPADAVSRLGAGASQSELSMAYMPENRSELLWAAADTSGVYTLYGADILDDGTLDHTSPLDKSLGEGGDALFPFLMPDGMTLYFANNGENSLGGYDIFMTRRTDADGGGKEYYQPQNVGMPYNSPYNDYLLAIDEASGLGWWASDRSQIPGKVTIYVFIPSSVRVNEDPDDPQLGALALLSDISLTQKPGVDYKALLASKLPEQTDASSDYTSAQPSFALDLGNGSVYYRLSDFRNQRARSAMLEALASEAGLRKHLAAEEGLRERYRRGDRSVADAILQSEQETAQMRTRIVSQRNAAIRLETK